MNFKKIKYKVNYIVLLLLVFVIPLERRLAPPLIVLFLITSVINNRFRRLSSPKLLLFTSLFILYAIGLFYSDFKAVGMKDLIEKLSLLIFPLIIYFSGIDYKTRLNTLLKWFVYGCFFAALISLMVSSMAYFNTFDTAEFFYGKSSYFLHPSYMAMYSSFSLLIVYQSFLSNKYRTKKEFYLCGFMLLFFSMEVILSSSKTGLISLLIIHAGALSYWTLKNKFYLKGIGMLVLLLVGLSVVYTTSLTIQGRVGEFIKVAKTGNTSKGSTTAARVEIWKLSIGIIAKKPIFGYGTGEEKSVLIDTYHQLGFNDFAKKKLNAHNQFLQTTIAIGLVGGTVFLLMLLIPFYLSFKKQTYLYCFFIALIFLNLLTESMIERQAGVVFYALFNALFFISYLNDEEKQVV